MRILFTTSNIKTISGFSSFSSISKTNTSKFYLNQESEGHSYLSQFFGCKLTWFLSLLSQVQQRNLGVSGRIFTIESTRARFGGRGNVLKLKVNFLPEIITLSKEVHVKYKRVLLWSFFSTFKFTQDLPNIKSLIIY